MEFFNRDVETCCFCCMLREGNIVLGVTNAVFSALGVLAGFLSQGYDEETQTYEPYSGWIILLIIVCMCKFFFDVLFVYGVVKGNPSIVRGYYIMYMVFTSIGVFGLVLCSILLQWGSAFGLLFNILLNGYFFIAIRSYYRKLLVREIV